MAKKRVLLSIQVHDTQRLLIMFLTIGVVLLGTVYIFLFNRVAMRGYVLQQETEKNYELLIDREEVYSKIAQYETQDFISEAPLAQIMFVPNMNKRNFAIIKENVLTAKK
jgi:hypothetical protein